MCGLMVAGIGVCIMIAGVGFGIYTTLVWGWVGGIVQVIDAAKLTPVDSVNVAWGVVRVVGAHFIGALIAWPSILFGCGMVAGGSKIAND